MGLTPAEQAELDQLDNELGGGLTAAEQAELDALDSELGEGEEEYSLMDEAGKFAKKFWPSDEDVAYQKKYRDDPEKMQELSDRQKEQAAGELDEFAGGSNWKKLAQAGSTFLGGYPESRIDAVGEYLEPSEDFTAGQKAASQGVGYLTQGAALAPLSAPLYGMAKAAPLALNFGRKLTGVLQALAASGVSAGVAGGTAAVQAHGEERDVGEAATFGAAIGGVLSLFGSLLGAGGRYVANKYFRKASGQTKMGAERFADATKKNAPLVKEVTTATKVTPDGRKVLLDPGERKELVQETLVNRINQKYTELREKFSQQFQNTMDDLGLSADNKTLIPGTKKEIADLTKNIEANTGSIIPEHVPQNIAKNNAEISMLKETIVDAKNFIKQVKKGSDYVVKGKTKIPITSDRKALIERANKQIKITKGKIQGFEGQNKTLQESPDLVWVSDELRPVASKTIKEIKTLSATADDSLTVGQLLTLRQKIDSVSSTIRAKVEGKHIGPKSHRAFLKSLDDTSDFIKEKLYSIYQEEGLRNLDYGRFTNFRKTVEKISNRKDGGKGFAEIKRLANAPDSGEAKILSEFMDPAREAMINETVARVGISDRKLIGSMLDKKKWSKDFLELPEYFDIVENMNTFYKNSSDGVREAASRIQPINKPLLTALDAPGAVMDMITRTLGGKGGTFMHNPRFLSAMMSPEHSQAIYKLTQAGPSASMALKRYLTEMAVKYDLDPRELWKKAPKTVEAAVKTGDDLIDKLYE